MAGSSRRRGGPIHVLRARLPVALLIVTVPMVTVSLPAMAQTVSGRVVETETGDPVPSAMVALAGTSHGTFTDDEGRFRFEDVPSGSYRITVDHLGYRPLERTLFVPAEGLSDLVLPVEVRAIPMDSLRVRTMPEPKRRRQTWHSHHVLVTREEIETAELRGAWHVGDVLRLHASNAVRVEESVAGNRWGPLVCIRSTRAIGSRTPANPSPGCAPVFIDGIRVGNADPPMGAMLLASLSLNDIESIEFLPPMDAITRLGHAGQDGALLVKTRIGADRTRGLRTADELSDTSGQPGRPGREAYLAAGATGGVLVGFGAASVEYLLHDDGGLCRSGCQWEVVRILGSALVGLGVGELLHRWREREK